MAPAFPTIQFGCVFCERVVDERKWSKAEREYVPLFDTFTRGHMIPRPLRQVLVVSLGSPLYGTQGCTFFVEIYAALEIGICTFFVEIYAVLEIGI